MRSRLLWAIAATFTAHPFFCNGQQQGENQDLDDPQFIGYYIDPDFTMRYQARGQNKWVTSGSFAGDCFDTRPSECEFVTECAGSDSMVWDNGQTVSCTDTAAVCLSILIYQTYPDGRPVITNYACRPSDWYAHTLYRVRQQDVVVSTHYVTGPAETSTTAPPSPTGSNTAISSTPKTPSETSPPSTDDSPQSSAVNKGLIAGVVVGPIAALALAAAAFAIWWRRRQRRGEAGAAPAGQEADFTPSAPGGPGFVPQYQVDHQYQYGGNAFPVAYSTSPPLSPPPPNFELDSSTKPPGMVVVPGYELAAHGRPAELPTQREHRGYSHPSV